MTLALKGGYLVCESVSTLHQVENSASVMDLEDSDNENEEKTEFDEKEKINQYTDETRLFCNDYNTKSYALTVEINQIHILEFSTPPPEFS